MKKYYITTPIYYVNSAPHLGHAYSSVACDVIARFKRLDGYDVHFLTGTDEHGEKIQRAAQSVGVGMQTFVDSLVPAFKNVLHATNCCYNDFIRTTEKRHEDYVRSVWKRMVQSGDIYLGRYAGWYSVRDEAFFSESELVNGKAPSGADVSWVEEPSYFFRLSKWQEPLLKFYEQHPDFVAPKAGFSEVMSFVRGGLRDLSVSRTSVSWGIPVPDDECHVMYVWIDALFNYISALEGVSGLYNKFWPCDLHVVGKEIVRFHAVYWPAFLMALGVPLPKRIFAHGWWMLGDGEKMSKSLGNVVDPVALCGKYGTDSVRYFLMRDIPFGGDGNYVEQNLVGRVNAELVNSIGNLVQRVLTIIHRNCVRCIPIVHSEFQCDDLALLSTAYATIEKMRDMVDRQEIHNALGAVYELSNKANVYIDWNAPWNLCKSDVQRMEAVLYVLAEVIRVIGVLLQPFVPDGALSILQALGIAGCDGASQIPFACCSAEYKLNYGQPMSKPAIIFPRLIVK